MAEEVKLLNTWPSPFGLRVVWALKLKGIEYESVDEDLSNKSALLLHSNPVYKKIPVLIHNARQRFWAKFSDDRLLPAIWRVFVTQGKEREEAMEASLENLKFVEEELEGKRFFGGDKIGLADLAFGWFANLIGVLQQLTGLKLIDDRFPLLSAWIQEFSETQIIKDNWPSHDKPLVMYQALYHRFHPLK
ncbi:hypothetical protein V6N12_053622 [Hibiscus sabdariffa]|uniref:glutathione transferase n=1 Tax=Hibiscus sabdariffa TaxID=183260 RepID=A0ABR2D843_9ROSI